MDKVCELLAAAAVMARKSCSPNQVLELRTWKKFQRTEGLKELQTVLRQPLPPSLGLSLLLLSPLRGQLRLQVPIRQLIESFVHLEAKSQKSRKVEKGFEACDALVQERSNSSVMAHSEVLQF